MARQTRAQRRARREAQAASAAAAGAGGASLPAAAAPPMVPPRRPPVARAGEDHPRERRGFPGARFIGESWGELKKVEWPGQNQVIQGTVVVLVACIVIGFYLYVSDQAFKRLVENVFLR